LAVRHAYDDHTAIELNEAGRHNIIFFTTPVANSGVNLVWKLGGSWIRVKKKSIFFRQFHQN